VVVYPNKNLDIVPALIYNISMGFKYNYDAEKVYSQINYLKSTANSRYNDGFIQFGAKQDLYKLKWAIEEALSQCPAFGSTEDDWVRNQEKEKLIKILKNT
jgi:hypothetical protein